MHTDGKMTHFKGKNEMRHFGIGMHIHACDLSLLQPLWPIMYGAYWQPSCSPSFFRRRTMWRHVRRRLTRSLNHFINHSKRSSKPIDLENEKKKPSKSASFQRILSQVEPVKYRLGGAFVLSTFSSGIMMTIPYFTGWVIDHAVAGTIPIEQITTAGALLFGVQFGSNFFRQGSADDLNATYTV